LLIQKLDPSVGLTKGEVFEYLGVIAEKQGDKAKAIDMYKRALDNDPSRTKAKENLAALK
jgi:golgin subfamily B member 1